MDGVKRRGLSDAAAGTVLLVVGAACAGLLMSQERVLMPAHLPTLTLPADQVAARMADDRRREQLPAAERSAALEELLMGAPSSAASRTATATSADAERSSWGTSTLSTRAARRRPWACGRGPRRASSVP